MNGDEKNDYNDNEVKLEDENIQQSSGSKEWKRKEQPPRPAPLRISGRRVDAESIQVPVCSAAYAAACVKLHVLCAPILRRSVTYCQTGGPT